MAGWFLMLVGGGIVGSHTVFELERNLSCPEWFRYVFAFFFVVSLNLGDASVLEKSCTLPTQYTNYHSH